MKKSNSKPLRVGFDMDGVLLYNPARIIRPFISLLKKKKVLERKELEFYVPHPGWEEFFWEMLHKSSFCLAPGYKQILQLRKQNLIEPYLITARFNHLKKDYLKWKKRMKADEVFKQCFINDQDEQPHLFKERMIKELKLDVFVEDNWDIVHYLDQMSSLANKKNKPKIIWVSNIFDHKIKYFHKVTSLKQAINLIFKNQ